jgi:bifunctional non-homologous end joining protein LigD
VSALIRPMLASAGTLPNGPGWGFEFKWDGVRAVAYVDDRVRLVSRNDRDISASYPELQAVAGLVGRPVVLDGEIVALDAAGRPSFGSLQSRMHVGHPSAELLRQVPVGYYVFDLLEDDGERLLRTPYVERRRRLEALGLTGDTTVQVPPAFVGIDGADILEAAHDNGFEGVVAKRLESVYEAGRRSRSWVKVPLIRTQEVVVGGWKPGEGRRVGTVGSLLLGAYDDTGLRYIGHVGTGFTEAVLRDLHTRMTCLAADASPFVDEVPRDRAKGARWIRPDLVGEVEFRQWTRDGRLRHSSWRGLRPDKSPADVRLPDLPA